MIQRMLSAHWSLLSHVSSVIYCRLGSASSWDVWSESKAKWILAMEREAISTSLLKCMDYMHDYTNIDDVKVSDVQTEYILQFERESMCQNLKYKSNSS